MSQLLPAVQAVPVTAWWHWDKDRKGFVFNHIEDGWSTQERPHDPTGRRWTRGTWHRSLAELRLGCGVLGSPKLVLLQPRPDGELTSSLP